MFITGIDMSRFDRISQKMETEQRRTQPPSGALCQDQSNGWDDQSIFAQSGITSDRKYFTPKYLDILRTQTRFSNYPTQEP